MLSKWLKRAAMGCRRIAAKAVTGKRWSLLTAVIGQKKLLSQDCLPTQSNHS
jgi:hypothetical protein